MKAIFENVNLLNIVPSVSNPRKSFDQKALEELAESIKIHGLLQPILVRPILDSFDKKGLQQYEIVYGERRFRASKLAKSKTIKAEIRTINDDEAFEIQIIENLERKDVHPLDEADGFKKMLDSGKYSIADISAKMAKTETFISQRLKLSDLIEEVRQDFINGYLGIGHAVLIARCDEFKQLDIYNEAKPWKEIEEPNYGTIKELKNTIEEDTFDLATASFDLSDESLVSECGACTMCNKHSGSNPVLFEDMQDVDRCFDDKCFNKKEQAQFYRQVTKIVTEANNVVLVSGYSKPDDFVLQLCKQYDVSILNYNDWWAGERDGTIEVNAFYISGSDIGKYKQVWIKNQPSAELEESQEDNQGPKTPLSIEVIEAKEEIQKIEVRQKRALELDDEKIWQNIRTLDNSEIKSKSNDLSQIELNALCYAMIDKLGYYGNSEVRKLVDDFNHEFAKNKNFTQEHYNQISRIFLLNTLPNACGSHENMVSNIYYFKVIQEYYDCAVSDVIVEQKSIAEKRISKANGRITDLQAKIEKVNPVVEEEFIVLGKE